MNDKITINGHVIEVFEIDYRDTDPEGVQEIVVYVPSAEVDKAFR